MKTTNCPACGAKGIHAVTTTWNPARLPECTPLGPCGECGWCHHTTDICDYTAATGLCERCNRPARMRRDWTEPEDLPRPRGMGDEEFAFRASLYVVWKTRPASELASQLLIFADWLGDRGSAEEIAARADWKPYANKRHDPKGWYQWSVPAGDGWVMCPSVQERPGEFITVIDDSRARLTKSMHNGRWFLCWPPGFVRFTAPLSHDPSRWRVTVQANRLEGSTPSRPVERVWPGGYGQLLAPFAAPRLDVRAGLVAEGAGDLGLFAEESA